MSKRELEKVKRLGRHIAEEQFQQILESEQHDSP
jgi:hypothetical protein